MHIQARILAKKWQKSFSGWIKINTDAIINKELRMSRFRCVARNASELFLMTRTSKYRGVLNLEDTEAM